MVGSAASMVGGKPRSRRVWVVMGPMEARVMLGGRVRLADSRRLKRLVAVELLVKVMASGWVAGEAKSSRSAEMDSGGVLVAVGVGDGDVSARGGEGFGEDVAGLLGSDEEHGGGIHLWWCGLGGSGLRRGTRRCSARG